MRGLLARAQHGLMRGLGMRKLREALDAKSDATQADLLWRLDILQAALTERDRVVSDRLDILNEGLGRLSNELSSQGQSATERGDTDQATLRGIRIMLDVVQNHVSRRGGSAQTLGELRAEISGLRADFALQAEVLMDHLGSRGGSAQTLGELRAEISGLRADFALQAEVLMDHFGSRTFGSVP